MPHRHHVSAIGLGALLLGAGPAAAADLTVWTQAPAVSGAASGGGFRVARVPMRPAPTRFDIDGYPLLRAPPSPLAVGTGCPAALQPDYDPDGNLAGYAPIPLCR